MLDGIKATGGVDGDNCSGQVGGIQQYFRDQGYTVVNIMGRAGFGQISADVFTKLRQYLSDGYLIFTHTNGHFLGIYAADNNGNFYLFDPGARANSPEGGKAFTEAQFKSGDGMGGPATGFGLNEFWAVKK
jgi:hypothetical protein